MIPKEKDFDSKEIIGIRYIYTVLQYTTRICKIKVSE